MKQKKMKANVRFSITRWDSKTTGKPILWADEEQQVTFNIPDTIIEAAEGVHKLSEAATVDVTIKCRFTMVDLWSE
jgi:hypothetical protein